MKDFINSINSIKLSGKRSIGEKIVAVLLALMIVFCSGLGIALLCEVAQRGWRAEVSFNGRYKNIILMIGDGMGFNHIECAEKYYGEPSFMRSAALGEARIVTDSEKLFLPTDSAASATALSTGKKTDNGAIARYMGKNIATNSELAKSLGLAVGIIASEGVDGATPSAFSSHANNRRDSEEIFSGQLASGIDLFVGGNRKKYDKLSSRIVESGYTYFNQPSVEYGDSVKVWGAYDVKSLPTDLDDGISLAEMAVKAMGFLEKASDNGYFLMIEESYIDKRSHNNDMLGMLEKFKSYDETIKAVVQRATADGDTLVIVTADHETGKLTFPSDADFKNPKNNWFKSGGHTRRNVPCFYYSPVGIFPSKADNTQIADMCAYFIKNR